MPATIFFQDISNPSAAAFSSVREKANASSVTGPLSLTNKKPAVQWAAGPFFVFLSHHCSGDDGHLVDLVSVAATGQVIDGSGQALQDGAVGLEAAQTLGDLVADVAGLDGGEDEGVGIACDRGSG